MRPKMKLNSVEFVFAIPMLRDRILHYVIWDAERTSSEEPLDPKRPNMRNAANLRLVNHNWAESTARLITGFPLLTLNLHSRPDLDRVVNLIETGSSPPALLSSAGVRRTSSSYIPTHRLILRPGMFRQENIQGFGYSLMMTGAETVELEFQFPVDATMTATDIPWFSLPRLRSITVDITEILMDGSAPEEPETLENEGKPVPTGNFLPLLQRFILASSPSLHHIRIIGEPCRRRNYFPTNFTDLSLPTWLTQVDIETSLNAPQSYRILLEPRNLMPNLHRLHLYGFIDPTSGMGVDTVLVTQIFRTVGRVLGNLILDGYKTFGLPWAPGEELVATQIGFPGLQSLTTLKIISRCWAIGPVGDGDTSLVDQLPRLENLKLTSCTAGEFQERWGTSTFGTVERFTFRLMDRVEEVIGETEKPVEVDEDPVVDYEAEIGDEDDQHDIIIPAALSPLEYIPLTRERMQLIHQIFPNLTHLHLTFMLSPEVENGMLFVFTEMRGLRSLELMISGDPLKGRHRVRRSFWDSVLTGLSADEVIELRHLSVDELERKADRILNGEDGEGENGGGDGNRKASIINLENLENLLLACQRPDNRRSVISQVTIYFGFLRLRRLRSVVLSGGFHVNRETQTRWENWKDNSFH